MPTPRAYAVALALASLVSLGVDAGNAAGASATTLDDRPNLVVIVTDDQRAETIRHMPALQRLVRDRGVKFSNGMVPTSNCCPSRASILTGLFSHSTRVFSNQVPHGGWRKFHDRGLEERTFAVALDDAGYRTGMIGKYLNGFMNRVARRYVPPGWDRFITFWGELGYFNYGLTDGTVHGSSPRDYSTDVLKRRALRFIRSTPAEKPMLLYFAPWAPHRPTTAAPRHQGTWQGRLPSHDPPSVTRSSLDKPPWIRGRRARQAVVDRKLAKVQDSLMAVDDAVRKIVRVLEKTGRMSNTLLIFMSDNGLLVGEHHLVAKKNLPYDAATRIPLLARWDGRIARNSSDRRLALNVDLAATLTAAAGVSMDTEGLDLLGTARRSGFPVEAGRRYPADSGPDHPAYCGYRTLEWLYVQYATGQEELYSYAADPHELRNLADRPRYAGRQSSMRAQAVSTCFPVPPAFSWPD
jgi:arylsulfatase A-like enzyme